MRGRPARSWTGRGSRRRAFVPVLLAVGLVASLGTASTAVEAAPSSTSAPSTVSGRPLGAVAGPDGDPSPEAPPGSDSGRDILGDEPNRIDDIAAANDVSAAKAERILSDETTFVSEGDRIFYVEPEPPSSHADDAVAVSAAPYADTFKLNSKPGSSRTIYLDFDGQTVSGTYWAVDDGGPFSALAYSPDGVAGFSASELQDIQTVWQVVAEDYAPFDVNVTTQDPGIEKLRRSTAADTDYGTRVVLTDSTAGEVVDQPVGGIAFFDAFDAIGAEHDKSQPAWVFASQFGSKKALGDVVSHEVGHNLGLEHDGSPAGEYYSGHGVWAPIMGNSYVKPVAQWSKGEYNDANNPEDDFAVMASHGAVTRVDDHTNVLATATPLTSAADGVIASATDQDLFKFVAASTGTWNFRVVPDVTSPDLDIKATLLNAAGAQVAQANPTVVGVDEVTATGLDASIAFSVTSGTTYYLRVEGSSHLTPATGYSTYASVGQYSVTASSGPACAAQDTNEPNDSLATAAVATSGLAISSRTCRRDVDYFGVPVLQGQSVGSSLLFTHAQGDLNMALFDPSGVQVASATSTANNETINHTAAKTGIYVIEVSGKDGAANTYSLTMTSPLCPPDDSLEDNDTSAAAKALQAGVAIQAISCVGDQDYYSFPVPADGAIEVELDHASRFGAVAIQLLSSTGTIIDEDQNEFGDDTLYVSESFASSSDVRRIRVVPGSKNSIYSLVLRSGPLAPTAVSAVAGPGSATINWTDPTSNGGAPIYGYAVTAYVDGVEVPSTTSDTKPAVVSYLEPGVSHTFKVRAINSVGQGAPSAASNAVTPLAPLLPGPPSGVNATPRDGGALVSWAPPADDGGAYPTGYVVTPYIGATAQSPRQYGPDSFQQEVTGLTNGTAHTFKVAAQNASGTGAQSAASSPVTPVPVPGAPTGVVAVAGYESVKVSWTAPAPNSSAPITDYLVTVFSGGNEYTDALVGGAATSITIDLYDLQPYTFKVAAKNVAGTGVRSAASNSATPNTTPTAPGAPTNVSAYAGNGGATVQWSPARENGSPITGYVVTPYIGATAQAPRTFNNSDTFQTITGLTNGSAYTFKVAAKNAIGTSPQSVASDAVTPAGPPGVATGVTAVAGNGNATVSWTAPASNGGSPITGYEVTAYTGGFPASSEFHESPATTQTVPSLANGTSYTFTVTAYNAVGGGTESAASNAVTPNAVASVPGAPTGVAAVAGNAQATVSWSAPASNGGSAITGYVVTPFVGATAQPPLTFNSTATSQPVTGLTNGTAYTFKVAAKNAVGTGTASAASNAVTPTAVVPGAPTSVAAVAGNAQATVSWSAPASNGGSAITGYVVTPFVGATAQPPVTFNSTATSQPVTGLTNGTAYTFKVAAKNAVGTGTSSAASNAVTPTAVAVAPYAPFASWSAFVQRQYIDLTTKAPSSSALSAWVTALGNGSKAKGQLDDELRRGSENLANVDPVVRVYRAFLGRAPDAGGLQFWIRRKRNVAPAKTWTVTQIATEFTNSNEFKTKYGSLTNRQFVTQIYTDVLGRTADQNGVNYWTGKLDRKEKTKAQVVVGFSESNEYKTKQAQNTDVAVAYIYLMGRAPTPAEASDWVTRQKAGTTHAVLLTELLNSPKYATHITG
ncbi:MAG: hypothetical protein JWO77_239 [Ilumatobacteraceae bacterium]|nr:hypothetical protein [Ilumatobacteraceae bacterium]